MSTPSGSSVGSPGQQPKSPRGLLHTLGAVGESIARLPDAQQDFFRTRLWSPAPAARKPPASFNDVVLAGAAELVGPSSSAAPPVEGAEEEEEAVPRRRVTSRAKAPRPSGVNVKKAVVSDAESATPPRRSGRRRLQPLLTPSPVLKEGKKSASPFRGKKSASPPGGLARKKKTDDKVLGNVISKVFSREAISSPIGQRRGAMRSPSPLPPSPKASPKASPKMSPKASPKMKPIKGVLKDDGLLKPSKRISRQHEKALVMTTIPVSSIQAVSGPGRASSGRPQRARMAPLESWRNERLVYGREKGSDVPSIVAVELNMGGRPEDAKRKLAIPALQPPLPVQKKGEPLQNVEFVGICTPALSSKVFALPLKNGEPYTVCLKGRGVVHILEGSLRYQSEDGKDAGELRKGDTMVLRGLSPLLVAPAGRHPAGSIGARFHWVEVTIKKKKVAEAAPAPIAAS